jgi:hypothetical protein
VDWTSTPAYADALPPHVLADARFRLVRVDGQETYTLTCVCEEKTLLPPPLPLL